MWYWEVIESLMCLRDIPFKWKVVRENQWLPEAALDIFGYCC